MNETERITATAMIAALVEGLRALGPLGANEDKLHEAVSTKMDRKAFDMIVAELIEQKTFRRSGSHLVYCGPSPLAKPRVR